MKKFWNWKAVQDETGETTERVLEINGEIASEPWFDDDVTPKIFKDELFAGNGPVTIWLNSPGGDCIAASQIYSMLMDYPGNVTIKVDGIAASAASVIAMAGTTVLMAPTALMMIHNPMTIAYGNAAEMTKAIEMLDEVKESIVNAYEIKTGLSRARISHLMDAETWMNANKAIELGFADDDPKWKKGDNFEGYPILGTVDEASRDYPGASVFVAIGNNAKRADMYARLRGHDFPALIGPKAQISPTTDFRHGTFIGAGAVVQVGSELGKFTVIGSNAVISHDAVLDDFVNVGAGTVIASGVKVGKSVSFFANCATMPWITIGAGVTVSCGTGVKADVPAGAEL